MFLQQRFSTATWSIIDETEKMYRSLYEVVVEHFRAKEYDSADQGGNALLLTSGLPITLRARCHTLLRVAGADRSKIYTKNFSGGSRHP